MAETDNPHEALRDKAVSVRAAASLDLAREGGVEDVPLLLEMVATEKSPSVRLYAAAAAAEILMRHRGAYDQKALSTAKQRELLDQVARIDPTLCPSITLCYSAFPSVHSIKRLVRMLRDPRGGIRLGAAAALRRMALSGAAVTEGTNLREWVGDALDHPKLPTDTRIEMVKLVGEVGWSLLRPRVIRAEGAGGLLAEAARQALERLDIRAEATPWKGVWADEGRDVQQLKAPMLTDCHVLDVVSPIDGRVDLDGVGSARLVFAPRLGEAGQFLALQAGGRTWWKLEGKALVSFVEAQDQELREVEIYAERLANELEQVPGAAAVRARALLWLRCGFPERVAKTLAGPLAVKKPRNDLYFLYGMAMHALGQAAAGDKALALYLEKAKKKDPWRAEAEALTR